MAVPLSLSTICLKPKSSSRDSLQARGWRGAVASIALVLLATAVCLLLGELAIRFATHTPLLQLTDLRAARVARNANAALQYDPLLGWRLRPFITSPGFNTLEYGLRTNSVPKAPVKTGGVLAVGSSFTAGSDVIDQETWSAHLERLLGKPVNNAGQGGYSADQVVLLAEELLPILKPETLVVDLIADNIHGVAYSSYGMHKPYFSVSNGKLVHHNNPVPNALDTKPDPSVIKAVLAHSAAADRFMLTFFEDFWLTSGRSVFTRTNNDVVAVTCLLLKRLHAKTNAAGVRLILYLQFAGSHIIGQTLEPLQVTLVSQCAQADGIQVVNEFETLQAAATRNVDELRSYYVREPDGSTGHKSSAGNLLVAKMVQAALANPPPQQTLSTAATKPAVEAAASETASGAGTNLLRSAEILHMAIQDRANASLDVAGQWWRRRLPFWATQYVLAASGGKGEHFVSVPVPIAPGQFTVSAIVLAGTTSRFSLQLSDSSSGAVGHFDLARQKALALPGRDGQQAGPAGMTPTGRGWYRVWLTTPLASGRDARVTLQLLDSEGNTAFDADGTSLAIRGVQVERGYQANRYVRPSGLDWLSVAWVRLTSDQKSK